MSKFSKGDIAIVTDRHGEGTVVKVENWRGGSVAPYVCRVLESNRQSYEVGQLIYKSGREMELKSMNRKHKVYCSQDGCSIYSFEPVGVIVWLCSRHDGYGEDFTLPPKQPTVEEKIDLLLDHLNLEIVTQPAATKIKKLTKEKS